VAGGACGADVIYLGPAQAQARWAHPSLAPFVRVGIGPSAMSPKRDWRSGLNPDTPAPLPYQRPAYAFTDPAEWERYAVILGETGQQAVIDSASTY
jgi:hypothetical protein